MLYARLAAVTEPIAKIKRDVERLADAAAVTAMINRGQEDVELLFNRQRPVVLSNRWCVVSAEVVHGVCREHPIFDVERAPDDRAQVPNGERARRK